MSATMTESGGLSRLRIPQPAAHRHSLSRVPHSDINPRSHPPALQKYNGLSPATAKSQFHELEAILLFISPTVSYTPATAIDKLVTITGEERVLILSSRHP